jgi:DMSO reductase anchor subunit
MLVHEVAIRHHGKSQQGEMTMPDSPATVSTWRKVLAAILDFITIFVVGGYAIAKLTGNTNESGFQLNGVPAIVLFVAIGLYFWLGGKYRFRLWKRILKA